MKGVPQMTADRERRRSSLYIAAFALLLFSLACGTATMGSVRIRDIPQFICATSVPLATHTQLPTQVQPPVYVPPAGYVTYTPAPGCIWQGAICATSTPYPGGLYTSPGHYLPGATSTPRPTHTPWPTATPYVLSGRFFLGADVYTGGFESEISLRLRIAAARVYPVDATRQVVAWDIEIENVGQVMYATIPGGQVFVAEVAEAQGRQTGQWWASSEAARAAGIPLQPQVSDALEVLPGEQHQLTLTAFTPPGEPVGFGWILDPLADGRDGDLVGGNVAYWSEDVSAACTTNPSSDLVVPSPEAPPPTATPVQPPQYPPWCTWCGAASG